ncbi:uncharacterized protein KY384_007159 [Bacidia gigantensis]|uniref:uncharacterized protein n=1 Tax=Bacidia gigantensis TaxID=2732470 RepID=UPI001D049682|nr:uncharacterized protein KY384_007159 [Bacidia gigantensis]KAG8528242.1 hypothetical protein KY384_007159 [Bacidia gigantensis]
MVSHAQGPEQQHRTLSHRAPSVASSSRTTSNRRHRSSRSHSGGGTYKPQNEFPYFAQTGDVEIIINADGQERRYMLHRLILSQNAGFFEASTSEEWAKVQQNGIPTTHGLRSIGEDGDVDVDEGQATRPLRNGEKIQLRYELDWGNKEEEVPMLVQRQPQSTLFGGHTSVPPSPVANKPSAPATGFLRSMSNFSALQSASHLAKPNSQSNADSDTIRDYDNLFRIFYNYSPSLDAVNIAEAYIQCKSLLTLADMYDALDVVGPRIDHHLLQFQGRLWKQIAKYPPSYLRIGYLSRSKVIFAEALVHVVGQWPSGSSQLKHTVPEAVIEVIEDKVDELAERKMKAEARLFRINLTTPKGERVSPSNAYTDWLALSLFRQWLADNTAPAPPPPTSDSNRNRLAPTSPSPGSLYRKLGAGGSSYLGHDECKRFVRLKPDEHSREVLKRFEKKVDEIKGLAREIRPFVNFYGPTFILYELSSPFLNFHWFFDKLNMTGSKPQWYNGIVLLASFLGCRLLWGTYQSIRVYQDVWAGLHFDATSRLAKQASDQIFEPLGEDDEVMRYAGNYVIPTWLACVYLVSNIVLNTLNFYWFGKMIETVRKRFREPRDKKKAKEEGIMVEGLVDTERIADAVCEGVEQIIENGKVDKVDGTGSYVHVQRKDVRKRKG